MSSYKVNEDDITKLIEVMKILHPEQANREWAVGFLTTFHAGLQQIRRNNPDDIEKLFEKYEEILKGKKSGR